MSRKQFRKLIVEIAVQTVDEAREGKGEAWRQHIVALSSRHREEGERDTAPRLFLFRPVQAPEKKPRILRKTGAGASLHCAIAQYFL